jgi:hypothetical protein
MKYQKRKTKSEVSLYSFLLLLQEKRRDQAVSSFLYCENNKNQNKEMLYLVFGHWLDATKETF